MKKLLSIFILTTLCTMGPAQSVNEYFSFFGMTAEEIEQTGNFMPTTSSDYSNNQGVVLNLRKVGDTKRVSVISIYPDSSRFDKIYTMRSWEGNQYHGTLPHGLDKTMSFKQANKILKKAKGIEIHWSDKERATIGYFWDVETPMDKIDFPRQIKKMNGQMGMQRGLQVNVNFSKDGEAITHLNIDAAW